VVAIWGEDEKRKGVIVKQNIYFRSSTNFYKKYNVVTSYKSNISCTDTRAKCHHIVHNFFNVNTVSDKEYSNKNIQACLHVQRKISLTTPDEKSVAKY
jgi:hypothetical protein